MADLSYTVDVNTTGAVNSLKKVETQVKAVNDTFGKLKTVIAGLGFGTLIQGAYSYASAIDQASRATGIAISTVTDFSTAVASVGGNATKAAGDIIGFVAGLNEAKQGSASAQAQLKQVGISLQDLSSLSEQDIFKKTLVGLSQMEDAAMRNKLAIQLLGKQFKDIDVRQVAEAMGKTGGDTSGIKAAADASRNFSEAISILQMKLLAALEPVSKLAVEFLKFVSASKELWSWLKALGEALLIVAAFTLLGRAIGMVRAAMLNASLAAQAVGTSINVARLGFMAFIDTLKIVVTTGLGVFASLRSAILIIGQSIKTMGNKIHPVVFEALTDAIGNTAKALIFVFGGAITAALTLWNKFRDATKDTPTFLDQSEIDRENYLLLQKVKVTEKVIDANRNLQLEMSKNLRGYQDQNTELSRSMGFSNSLIGIDETRTNRLQKLFDLETSYLSQIKGMQEKYLSMKQAAAVGTKEEQNAFEAYAAIHEAGMAKITSEYKGQISEVNQLINQEEVLKSKEQDRQNALSAITQQMERQSTLGDQIRGANEKMNEALFENMQIRKSPMEQQLDKIKRDATEAGRQAGQAFAAGFDAMDMSVSQANELAKGLETISKAYEGIADQQAANFRLQQTVGEGMSSIMQNMNSAIDNFVTTGKFKFSDFARSVIQDLLKIELRAQASKLFSSISGGISGFLGSLFGGSFAEGGQPPVGKASIVGENGPELFVPKTAGTIVPNGGNVANAAQGNTYITNNISAIDAKSVAQLFAENRKVLFGSVQMAQKELSYGR
jgi:lambda family phage tail tape measure protein